MTSENVEYSLLWFIENYSRCRGKSVLASPEFTFEGLGCSSWSVHLDPADLKSKDSLYSVYLFRRDHDAGPEDLSLKLEISIITTDGSILYSEECEHAFSKGRARAFAAFVDTDELLARRNAEFLPGDTLGVRCRMWSGEGSVESVEQCTARTRIGIEKVCFLHRVQNFSALTLLEKRNLRIPLRSKSGCVLTSSLSLRNTCAIDKTRNGEFVSVSVAPSDRKYRLRKLKFSLLDASGNATKCAEVDDRFGDINQQIMNGNKMFTRKFILSKRKECLPNDELSLLCECSFYTGVEHMEIERQLQAIPVKAYNNIFCNTCRKEDSKTAEKLHSPPNASKGTEVHHGDECLSNAESISNPFPSHTNEPPTVPSVGQQMTDNDPHQGKCSSTDTLSTLPTVQDDLETLYHNQVLTDVALKTATKSFPAHKTVLCVRSAVFCAMLTNDVWERNTGCILHVEDLDDETVRRLLLFLYSDHLEELHCESALRLYDAADKYAIERLKVLCSFSLIDNMSTSNASELLLLADTHSDAELKQSVEDFILDHEKEVFDSEEWDKLSETNPQLVIKTMKLKYKREKGGK